MAQTLAFTRATCIPGTARNASAMLVAPSRLRSSLVSTMIAAGESNRLVWRLLTEVTLMLINSSRERSGGSLGGAEVSAARLVSVKMRQPTASHNQAVL